MLPPGKRPDFHLVVPKHTCEKRSVKCCEKRENLCSALVKSIAHRVTDGY